LDEAMKFLDAGSSPVVFTPGSAGSTMHEFFAESVAAAQRAGVRAMLITNFPQQVPASLPPGIGAFGYLPFSQVLPRASLLVYHGGVGTLSQGVKAAVPHLVVPHAYDQFDSGFRIRGLGLGDSVAIGAYRAGRVSRSIRALTGDAAIARRCREFATRVDGPAAVGRAVDLLEQLHAKHRAG
jgi:UDP:flavonoid glycosyltransferase YjiC (YdhE family)